jgi:hypothetical protein
LAKASLHDNLFAKYEITEQEARELVALMRCTILVLEDDPTRKLAETALQSSLSRQSVYTWIGRIVFLLLYLLRNLPVGRPSLKMAHHPLWQFIRSATMEPPEQEGA